MPVQPDKHITPEHADFINLVEQLEPADTGDLYPYVYQRGYHGSRNDQYALGASNDYSIRLAADQQGPPDKTAGFDWISESARLHGDHTIMYKYARRIRDAYNRRDQRLAGWREWLTYLDGQLIGFDFTGWYTRVPDNSHNMHHHCSKLRGYTTDWKSYAAMLSILAGESLQTWQAGQSQYQEEDVTPLQNTILTNCERYLQSLVGMTEFASVSDTVNTIQAENAMVASLKSIEEKPQVEPAPIDVATLVAALMDPQVQAVLVEAARQGANAAEDS